MSLGSIRCCLLLPTLQYTEQTVHLLMKVSLTIGKSEYLIGGSTQVHSYYDDVCFVYQWPPVVFVDYLCKIKCCQSIGESTHI